MILILLEKVKFFRNKFYTQCNSMAGVVKRLRPRIVVPICVGSNPTARPIFQKSRLKRLFFSVQKSFQGCNLLRGLIITDGAII